MSIDRLRERRFCRRSHEVVGRSGRADLLNDHILFAHSIDVERRFGQNVGQYAERSRTSAFNTRAK